MARPKKDNADYFPHDAGMRNDSRIKAVRKKFGQLEGYAMYCMLIEYLSHKNYFHVKLTDIEYEIMAGDFGVDPHVLKEFITYSSLTLDLFQIDDGYLKCQTLTNRMEFLLAKRKRDNTRVKFKDKVFNRDGYQCLKCGSEENLVLDHIVPVVKGGPDEIDNLQTLCKDCNSEKGTQIADYRGENTQSKVKKSKEKESKVLLPRPPVFTQTQKQVFENLKTDDFLMEDAKKIISVKGWRAVDEVDVVGLMRIFVSAKAKMDQPPEENKQHFKNWVYQERIEKLTEIATTFKKGLV